MDRLEGLTPAGEGWRAVFASLGGGGRIEFHFEPVACWGIYRDDERPDEPAAIVAMVRMLETPEIERADLQGDLVHLLAPGETLDHRTINDIHYRYVPEQRRGRDIFRGIVDQHPDEKEAQEALRRIEAYLLFVAREGILDE